VNPPGSLFELWDADQCALHPSAFESVPDYTTLKIELFDEAAEAAGGKFAPGKTIPTHAEADVVSRLAELRLAQQQLEKQLAENQQPDSQPSAPEAKVGNAGNKPSVAASETGTSTVMGGSEHTDDLGESVLIEKPTEDAALDASGILTPGAGQCELSLELMSHADLAQGLERRSGEAARRLLPKPSSIRTNVLELPWPSILQHRRASLPLEMCFLTAAPQRDAEVMTGLP
jgi:hypothetical protein